MPGEQRNSFYEKSRKINATLLQGVSLKTYLYHEAFPNVEFYANALGAAEGIQVLVNLMTVDMPNNPLTKHMQEVLKLHGKLRIELVQHSDFDAVWLPNKQIIRISNIHAFAPDLLIDRFIFELCNATNTALNIEYDAFENSEEYAKHMEIAEAHSSNNAPTLLEALGIPTHRTVRDIKECVESSHFAKGLKATEGFSHFDRYVMDHNDYLISQIKQQLFFINMQRAFSYCLLARSRKIQDYIDELHNKGQKLSVLLQEKYTCRDKLNEKARKNLQDCPFTEKEYEQQLRQQLDANRIEQEQMVSQIKALQALFESRNAFIPETSKPTTFIAVIPRNTDPVSVPVQEGNETSHDTPNLKKGTVC